MRLRRILLATLLPATLLGPTLLLAGPAGAGGGTCHSTSVTTGKGQTVEMRDNCYSPTVLQAAPGETVTFVNRDAAPHTVTGAGDWGTGRKDLATDDVFRVRLEEPGLYLYACVFHPGMMGAVHVGSDAVKVADSDAASIASVELASENEASEPSAEELEAGTASTTEEASAASAGAMVALGVAALGTGYGLGRLRRRTRRGTAG